MDIRLMLVQLFHVSAALILGALVLAGYRFVRRRSVVLGAVVGVAIVGRIALGLALFWISYLQLPIARSLQEGGGFWNPALDATGYYQMAARAADVHRLFALDHAVPSPMFVDALAVWMMTVGVSPAAGMFLNLCLYVAFMVIVAWCCALKNDWRSDLPCIVGVTAYSFWPVVLIHSTQPLKDELSSVLVALMCLGVLALTRLMHNPRTNRDLATIGLGALVVAGATLGSAAIRWYVGFMLWAALAVVLALFTFRGRSTPALRYIAGSVSALALAWFGFRGGAGPYYQLFEANLNPAYLAALPEDLMTMTQTARTGFLRSGGGTNIIVPLHDDPAAGLARANDLVEAEHASASYQERLRESAAVSPAPSAAALGPAAGSPTAAPTGAAGTLAKAITAMGPQAARAIPVNAGDQMKAVVTGLAVVFVPVSLVRMVAGLDVPGGRGLLAIADLDTVLLDSAIVCVLVLLWRRRHVIGDRLPFVVFGLILSGASAILLGYVVTNFGTLWRMRPLIMVPLWVLVIAVSPPAEARVRPDVRDEVLTTN